jgi:soluble P-type ATPase
LRLLIEQPQEVNILIPGFGPVNIHQLVLDYNGTLAKDGRLIAGVRESLAVLSQKVHVHIITADTFGTVSEQFAGSGYEIFVLQGGDEARAKLDYVKGLGAEQTVCIGNGRNDQLMLKEAALGIAVIQDEGVAVEALLAADVAVADILTGLGLLAEEQRLIATLRS